MIDPNTLPSRLTPDNPDIAALIEGLEIAKARGPRIQAPRDSKHFMIHWRASPKANAAVRLARHASTIIAGRKVSTSLVLERAMSLLLAHLTETLRSTGYELEDHEKLRAEAKALIETRANFAV